MASLTPDAPVVEHQGRTLDWRPRFDPRSLQYRVAAEATKLPRAGRLWTHGPVLDQGAEGACVGFGCAGEAAAEPAQLPGVTDAYARAFYHRAQQLDDWPGEAYDGTSVLAGCLTGRERGLWSGFQWATSAEELAAGIVRTAAKGGGPAIIGVEWRSGSYDTDALGVLTPSGDVVGGHCLCVLGFVTGTPDALRGTKLGRQLLEMGLWDGYASIGGPAFVILNSWGLSFGHGGLALVSLSVMRDWVRAGGEFAIPVGRKAPTIAAEGRAREAAEAQPATVASPDRTLHPVAAELEHGDRIVAGLPAELGQETATVLQRRVISAAGGRRVRVQTTAGVFTPSASDRLTVRRAVA